MPKSRPPYPAEFRQQIIELADTGKTPPSPYRPSAALLFALNSQQTLPRTLSDFMQGCRRDTINRGRLQFLRKSRHVACVPKFADVSTVPSYPFKEVLRFAASARRRGREGQLQPCHDGRFVP